MLNKIIIQGNLTKDPERFTTDGGATVARFGIACNNKYGGEEETVFKECKAFNAKAEFILKNMRKGSQVIVEGRLTQRRKDDKSYEDIIVSDIHFAGSGPKEQKAEEPPYAKKVAKDSPEGIYRKESERVDGIDVVSDDLPF